MKNNRLLFACLLFVFQNRLPAAPFLVICPDAAAIVSPEMKAERPHFFKKRKLVKLAARLGPSEWEEDRVHTKGMWMAFTGLILLGMGFGISVLLEVETISLFLVFAVLGILWAIMALRQAKKEAETTRFITRILAWTTIIIGSILSLLLIGINGG